MKKIFSQNEWHELKARVTAWKKAGQELVFTNGCFDILHDGHIALLKFARNQSGKTVVGLNSDQSVSRLKGSDRPVNTECVRAKKLLETSYIDAVVIYGEDTPQAITDFLEPDILIKGDDYRFETTIGAPEVTARGGRVLFFKRIPGISTTGLLNRTDKKNETNYS